MKNLLTEICGPGDGLQRFKQLPDQITTLMDIGHLKNAELEPKHQKYKGRVVLRGDIVKDDSGSSAVFRAGFVCITNDGRKSNGCHVQGYQIAQDKETAQFQLTVK